MNMLGLAAVEFDKDQNIDGLLAAFVASELEKGARVVGVLQTRGSETGDCHCADMDLTTIGSARTFRISQPLGKGSNGCRLHPGALADCSAFLDGEMKHGCDLLVLNRFGKGESEGKGFRDLISMALLHGIPVLVAVRSAYLDAWKEFAGEYGIILQYDAKALENWIASKEQVHAA